MNINLPTQFYPRPPKQGAYGRKPNSYLQELPIQESRWLQYLPGQGNQKLDRTQVVQICRDSKIHPLVAYACVMAWGGRDYGNYRRSLAKDNQQKLFKLAETLRRSKNPREKDFAETQKAAAAISGLGISFYTKLLFFLRNQSDRAYILDQWTAKSASVLFPEIGIKLTPLGLPDPDIQPSVYEAFCRKLESCCGAAGWGSAWKTGEDIELALFDRPRGPWRDCLKSFFFNNNKISRLLKAKKQKSIKHTTTSDPRLGQFLDILRVGYLKALESGQSLPETCGRFARPNRLHVHMQDGVLLQLITNKHETRAQMFLRGPMVRIYTDLVRELKPSKHDATHNFGGGIVGNGPKSGKTRALNLEKQPCGGWGSPENEWQGICKSAVDAMAELFGFLEPYIKP